MKQGQTPFKVGDEVMGRDKRHGFYGRVVFVSERLRVFVDFRYKDRTFQREFYRDGTMVRVPKSSHRQLTLSKV